MGSKKPWQDLEDYLTRPLQERYYTAVAAEVGFLAEGSARWQWEQCLDEDGQAQASPLVFDVSSLSKALMTAPMIWEQAHRHALKLGLPLGDFFPCLRQRALIPDYLLSLSVVDLLTHRSGLPAWRNFWMNYLGPETALCMDRELILERIGHVFQRYGDRASFLGVTGQDVYSDLGFILLGLGLTVQNARPLSEQFALLRRSLGKEEPSCLLHVNELATANLGPQVIPSAWCALRQRLLRGEIHDENAASLGGEAGHTGLFAALPGLSLWLRQLWHYQREPQLFGQDLWAGWRYGDDQASSPFGQGQARGHWGFTGTGFWLDPRNGAYAILLTNRVISGRLSSRIRDIRRHYFTEAARLLPHP